MKKLRKIFAVDDFIDEFEALKLRLENISDLREKEILVKEMEKVALQIPHLRGWPRDRVFWSEDAFLWKTLRVEKGIREFIKKELKVSDNNLDIGSGSYSYFLGVDFDFSLRMLKENDSSNNKVMGDAGFLPFKANSFDSVTMIFVCNYIDDLERVFGNIKKILRKNGRLFIVQSVVDVASVHSLVEKHPAKGFEKKLEKDLAKAGFNVKCTKKNYKKKSFFFFQASVKSARFGG